jgi:predicted transcriptional regulator
MTTPKEEVRKMLDCLPEGASFEDIQYQVYLLDEITGGEEELDRGEAIEHAEVKRRLVKY